MSDLGGFFNNQINAAQGGQIGSLQPGITGFNDQQSALTQGQAGTPAPTPGSDNGFFNRYFDIASGKDTTGAGGATGQTRGSAGSSNNLPLDQRWHAPTPWTGKIFQGKIARSDNPGRSVYFLFNPAEIQLNLGYKADQFNPSLTDINAESRALTNSLTTWGFKLIFDRHFEVMGGDPNGVLRDLMAFEQMMGFAQPHMGVIDPMPYDWFLGKYFHLFGQITACETALTLFNPDMIPMRAEVTINGQGMFGSTTDQFGGGVPPGAALHPGAAASTTTTTTTSTAPPAPGTPAPSAPTSFLGKVLIGKPFG